MPTDKPYVRKDNLRACSICGVRWHFSKMRYIGQNRWACPDDAEGLTAEQIARHNARVRPLLIKQFTRPLITGDIPDYHFTEGQAFNLICKYAASSDNITGLDTYATVTANTLTTTFHCAIYLSDIIRENVRPPSWIARAKVALKACADYARSLQFGPAGGAGVVAIDNITWGTFSGQSLAAVAHGALVLIRAWQDLGDQNGYRDGAIAACDALRQVCQRTDSPTTVFTTATSSPTARVYPGGFADSTAYTVFSVGSAVGAWAMAELRAVLGGSYVLGSTTATGGFTLVPSGTIDASIASARAFYVAGNSPGLSLSATSTLPVVMPLSASPYDIFSASVNGSANQNSWRWTFILADGSRGFFTIGFALALRAFFQVDGYSAAVATAYEWLMSFTSNPLNESPAGTTAEAQRNTKLGVFDPELGLPILSSVSNATRTAPAATNGPSNANVQVGYDIQATGLLAPVRAASGRDLGTFKATFTKPVKSRSLTPGPGRAVSQSRPDLRGVCGLSLQAFDEAGVVVSNAACFGAAYRFSPKMTLTLKAG